VVSHIGGGGGLFLKSLPYKVRLCEGVFEIHRATQRVLGGGAPRLVVHFGALTKGFVNSFNVIAFYETLVL